MSQPTARTPAQEVRTVVNLLMKRPITEEIAMAVKSVEGFKHLEIDNAVWIGFHLDEGEHGEHHGWIESLMLYQLENYVIRTKAGRVYPDDVVFVLDGEPASIRVMCEPDVSFVPQERATPTKGFIFGAPDLAVEIISPSQTYQEMIDQIDRYFRYGTKQAWLVIPDKQQIEVHTPDGKSAKYSVGQTISGGTRCPALCWMWRRCLRNDTAQFKQGKTTWHNLKYRE